MGTHHGHGGVSMIDWSQAPEWAIGAAMDKSGWWFWYDKKPIIGDSTWLCLIRKTKYLQIIPKPLEAPDWKQSWIEKPTNNMFTETKTTTEHPYTYGNTHDGLSLRDYFAGKALTGLVLGNDYGNSSDADIAKGAYEYADAMLEARIKNQES